MQPEHSYEEHGIVIISLDSFTLTPWTLHTCILAGFDPSKCYTNCVMRAEIESYFLNPPAGSAASRAAEFGIDLTLTLANLRLTPEERIQQLDSFIKGG